MYGSIALSSPLFPFCVTANQIGLTREKEEEEEEEEEEAKTRGGDMATIRKRSQKGGLFSGGGWVRIGEKRREASFNFLEGTVGGI